MAEVVRTVALRCASCGARLEISPDVDQFSCAYCGTEQCVVRSGGTIALKMIGEAIARVESASDRTAAELALQRLSGKIADLEREKSQAMARWDQRAASAFSTPLLGYGAAGLFIALFLGTGAGSVPIAIVAFVLIGGFGLFKASSSQSEIMDQQRAEREEFARRLAELHAEVSQYERIVEP